jgi:hypothetical protein
MDFLSLNASWSRSLNNIVISISITSLRFFSQSLTIFFLGCSSRKVIFHFSLFKEHPYQPALSMCELKARSADKDKQTDDKNCRVNNPEYL